jgi:putative transferase (TIGR04331 family)
VFLATTAISEFWDKDEDIVFLGSWCLRYDRREEWEGIKYHVLPYPWDDRERLEKAYKELQSVHERLLERLAEWLNHAHGLDRDTRYWRIVIGPWLQHFVAALLDRFTCLTDAIQKYPKLETIGLAEESYVTPRDFAEFTALSISDPYNLQLMTQMLEICGVALRRRRCPQLLDCTSIFASQGFLKRTTLCIAASLAKRMGVQLYLTLPLKARMRLLVGSGFQYWALPSPRQDLPLVKPIQDRARRESLSDLLMGDTFERLVSRLLPQNLPFVYLEDFQQLRELARARSIPKVIASDTGLHYCDAFKVYVAEMVNCGATLVGVQHGAYGIYKRMPVEEHELAICDTYWSWGWKTTEKIQPLPAAKLVDLREERHSVPPETTDILWVSTLYPRYLLRFNSVPLGPQFEEYLVWQQRFVSLLPDTLRQKVTWRPYTDDYGWAQVQRLRDACPALNVENPRQPFQKRMRQSTLLVIDHNSTAVLEVLAANKPSVFFWDPKRWEVRDSAAPFFDALRDAKVLHDTPESAAAHVATVYEDPWSWWGSETVQAARKKMVQNYANCSPDWIKSWCTALDSVSRQQTSRL